LGKWIHVLRLRPFSKRLRFTHKICSEFDGLATVVGNLPELSRGSICACKGNGDNHPKHGPPNSRWKFCEQTLPASVAGIQGYLGSGMIKRQSVHLAGRIGWRFKEDNINVIELKSGTPA